MGVTPGWGGCGRRGAGAWRRLPASPARRGHMLAGESQGGRRLLLRRSVIEGLGDHRRQLRVSVNPRGHPVGCSRLTARPGHHAPEAHALGPVHNLATAYPAAVADPSVPGWTGRLARQCVPRSLTQTGGPHHQHPLLDQPGDSAPRGSQVRFTPRVMGERLDRRPVTPGTAPRSVAVRQLVQDRPLTTPVPSTHEAKCTALPDA